MLGAAALVAGIVALAAMPATAKMAVSVDVGDVKPLSGSGEPCPTPSPDPPTEP